MRKQISQGVLDSLLSKHRSLNTEEIVALLDSGASPNIMVSRPAPFVHDPVSLVTAMVHGYINGKCSLVALETIIQKADIAKPLPAFDSNPEYSCPVNAVFFHTTNYDHAGHENEISQLKNAYRLLRDRGYDFHDMATEHSNPLVRMYEYKNNNWLKQDGFYSKLIPELFKLMRAQFSADELMKMTDAQPYFDHDYDYGKEKWASLLEFCVIDYEKQKFGAPALLSFMQELVKVGADLSFITRSGKTLLDRIESKELRQHLLAARANHISAEASRLISTAADEKTFPRKLGM